MQNAAADRTRANESFHAREVLIHALERLLIRHRSILKEEGVDRKVENLKHWLETNHEDFVEGGNISDAGNASLLDLCDGLKLAVEERQRLESEGGVPATKEQAEQNEALQDIIRRIEKIVNMDSTR